MSLLPYHQCERHGDRGYGEGSLQTMGTRCLQSYQWFESSCIPRSISASMCRRTAMPRETAVNAGDDTNLFTGTSPVSSSYGSLLCQAALDCRALSSSMVELARSLMMSIPPGTGSDDISLCFSSPFLVCLIVWRSMMIWNFGWELLQVASQ